MSPPLWRWDPSRRKRYRVDLANNQLVYEDGERVDGIPRVILAQEQAAQKAVESNSPASPPTAPSKADHRRFSHASHDQYTTARVSTSPPSPQTQQQTSTSRGFSAVAQLLASVNARGPFGVSAAFQSQTNRSQAQIQETNGLRVTTVQDPQTNVQTAFAGPSSFAITDPNLVEIGAKARQFLLPTPGEVERLDASYRIRQPAGKFFREGKVFLILWVEPAGENGRGNSTVVTGLASVEDPGIIPGRYGEMVFSKTRRFVVIREGMGYCSALAINTYGQKGVGKRGVVKAEHVIIHTSRHPPVPKATELPSRGEEGMRPRPIRITPDTPLDTLDEMSRLDLGKIVTIHHNIKVKPFGMVHDTSMDALKTQFLNVFHSSIARETRLARSGAGASGQTQPDRDPTPHPRRAENSRSGAGPSRPRQTPAPTTTLQSLGAMSADDRREAVTTFGAFQNMTNNNYTRQQAVQRLVNALQRRQPTLTAGVAVETIQHQIRVGHALTVARQAQASGSQGADNDDNDNEGEEEEDDDDDDDDNDDDAIDSGEDA